ncbi:MAG: hypothetical protein ACHQ4H_10665 [Ktedonobacterales bacterium]
MRRTLEALFRRPGRIICLIVLVPAIVVLVAYLLPRSYQAQASLWALRRYEIIGATGAETDLLSTPAQTQATALTELLQTRAFAVAVANTAQLGATLPPSVQSDPQARDDALYLAVSTRVVATAEGYNLFTVTYIDKSPVIAQAVVQAVVSDYSEQSQGLSVVEGQNLLAAYQGQLVEGQKAAAGAAQAEANYIAAHPQESHTDLLNDPQYNLLHAQTMQAQATLASLQGEIATLNQEIGLQSSTTNSLFSVQDQPMVPDRPVSRTKTLIVAGAGGLGGALVICAIYLALLVRRDRTLRTPMDVRRVTALPVLVQLPKLRKMRTAGTMAAIGLAEAPGAQRSGKATRKRLARG